MSKRNYWFLAVLIAAAAAFLAFAPSYGWRLRNFLGPAAPGADQSGIMAENETLKAELAKLDTVVGQLPTSSPGTIRSMVYSRYPLNFKNELLIDAGANDGAAAGKGVVFQGVLVGTIYQVFTNGSLVQTVFDPGFRMPVRVGTSSVDGLLQGGTEPIVVSIAKDATVRPGDIIYAAAPGIPYALPIGEVGDVSVSANALFQQASINFAYDMNGIKTVEVER